MGLCASAYTKNDCNKWHGIHSSPPNKVHWWRFQYQKANKSKTRAHTHSYPSAASPKIPNSKSSSSTFWLIFAMAKYYIRLNKTPETRRRHIERHAFYCKDFAYKYQSIERLYSQVYTCVRVFSQMTNAQQEKVCAKNHNHMMYVTFTLEVIIYFSSWKKCVHSIEHTPATKIGYKSIQFDGLNHSLIHNHLMPPSFCCCCYRATVCTFFPSLLTF